MKLLAKGEYPWEEKIGANNPTLKPHTVGYKSTTASARISSTAGEPFC